MVTNCLMCVCAYPSNKLYGFVNNFLLTEVHKYNSLLSTSMVAVKSPRHRQHSWLWLASFSISRGNDLGSWSSILPRNPWWRCQIDSTHWFPSCWDPSGMCSLVLILLITPCVHLICNISFCVLSMLPSLWSKVRCGFTVIGPFVLLYTTICSSPAYSRKR